MPLTPRTIDLSPLTPGERAAITTALDIMLNDEQRGLKQSHADTSAAHFSVAAREIQGWLTAVQALRAALTTNPLTIDITGISPIAMRRVYAVIGREVGRMTYLATYHDETLTKDEKEAYSQRLKAVKQAASNATRGT